MKKPSGRHPEIPYDEFVRSLLRRGYTPSQLQGILELLEYLTEGDLGTAYNGYRVRQEIEARLQPKLPFSS